MDPTTRGAPPLTKRGVNPHQEGRLSHKLKGARALAVGLSNLPFAIDTLVTRMKLEVI